MVVIEEHSNGYRRVRPSRDQVPIIIDASRVSQDYRSGYESSYYSGDSVLSSARVARERRSPAREDYSDWYGRRPSGGWQPGALVLESRTRRDEEERLRQRMRDEGRQRTRARAGPIDDDLERLRRDAFRPYNAWPQRPPPPPPLFPPPAPPPPPGWHYAVPGAQSQAKTVTLGQRSGNSGAPSHEPPPIVSCRLPIHRPEIPLKPSLVRPWTQSNTTVDGDGETELLTISLAEQFADESGNNNITLMREQPQDRQSKKMPTSLRWLHLQRQSLRLDHLTDLVFHCPYASKQLKDVALVLIDGVREKMVKTSANGTFFKSGSVVRYDGKYVNNPLKDDESVIFFAAPYLTPKDAARNSHKLGSEHSSRSLLRFLYNYEPGEKRDLNQVIRKVLKSSRDILHVSQLWCMLLGEGLFSCESLQYLRANSV